MIGKIPFSAKLLIILGALLLSSTMLRSGTLASYGLGFWGPNGHDAIWHLSVINQLKKAVPPLHPVFSGYQLSNYHWGFDLLNALISRFTTMSTLDVYFRLLPVTMALLIGLFSYKLTTKKHKSSVAMIFVFLNFFAGSFGWIITLLRSGQIGGESLFWSMQSASTLINPPYALSVVLLLSGLYFLQHHRPQNKTHSAILLGLYFSLLTAIKIYAAILAGLTFSLVWLIKKITKKSTRFDFYLPLTMATSSIFICFFLNLFSGATLLQLQPLWFTHTLIESIDKLYLPRLAALRQNLTGQIFSYKLPFLVGIEIFLIFLFLLGNMGIRILGLKTIYQKIKSKKLSLLDLYILPFMTIALIIPLLFVQKGTAWNTIQFFYYFLLFANFYLAQFLAKQKSKTIIVTLLLLAAITSYSTFKDYFGSPPPASIPQYELQALDYLKQLDSGIVLTYPYDKHQKDGLTTPLPLYTYETTAYVSAMTGHQTFLEDEMNLSITGYNWSDRRRQVDIFFNTSDIFEARGLLVNHQISYIYLVNHQQLAFSLLDLQVDKIYDNGRARIYQVQR